MLPSLFSKDSVLKILAMEITLENYNRPHKCKVRVRPFLCSMKALLNLSSIRPNVMGAQLIDMVGLEINF